MTKPISRWLRRTLGLAVLLLIALGVGVHWLHDDYRRFIDTPLVNGEQERAVEVRRGDSFVHVLRRLRKAGVSEGHDLYWRALAWELGVMRRLQVGEYAIDHDITPRDLLHRFERGAVIQHKITLIPGWNFRELRAALARDEVLLQTLRERSDAELMAAVNPAIAHPEGQFLPETYQFTRGSSDLDILKRAHVALQEALARAWAQRDEALPLQSADEALVLASIIEKETGLASERPAIAGVFVRRLRLGMRLQTDPTVIYGVGADFDGNLTRAHLDTDTPWNTYTRAGLPPTPIALAGWEALLAAVQPEEGESLYFVARGDGSHQFSTTLSEHNAAVRRFQLRR